MVSCILHVFIDLYLCVSMPVREEKCLYAKLLVAQKKSWMTPVLCLKNINDIIDY